MSEWHIDSLIGPPYIIQPMVMATTYIVFCSNSPLQETSAIGLKQMKKRSFLQEQLDKYTECQNILIKGFDKLVMEVHEPSSELLCAACTCYILLLFTDILICSVAMSLQWVVCRVQLYATSDRPMANPQWIYMSQDYQFRTVPDLEPWLYEPQIQCITTPALGFCRSMHSMSQSCAQP